MSDETKSNLPWAVAPRPPTIGDVAKAAGVSRSAVSRTFTEGASASPDTRAKVRTAAEALGYRPNALARSLSTRRSHLVAISTARLENDFNAGLLQSLAIGLDSRGLRTLLFPTAGPTADRDPPLDEILRHRVDAVVLLSMRLSSRFVAECAAVAVPVVLVNRTSRTGLVSSVEGDNFSGARRIARFLLAGEHRRFAFMVGRENSSTSREREQGFSQALRAAGLPRPMRVVGNYNREQAIKATRMLLSSKEPPDAIFCANDDMAAATLGTARSEFGLDIGRHLSVVGFDDTPLAGFAGVDLTTFSQSASMMAAQAVTTVCHLVAERHCAPKKWLIPGELVVRKSARRPAFGIVDAGDREVWTEDGIYHPPGAPRVL